MTPVKSSSIEAVSHNPNQRTMTVKFKSGDSHRYDGISADQHSKLVTAKSVGSHFHQNILGKFKATKI